MHRLETYQLVGGCSLNMPRQPPLTCPWTYAASTIIIVRGHSGYRTQFGSATARVCILVASEIVSPAVPGVPDIAHASGAARTDLSFPTFRDFWSLRVGRRAKSKTSRRRFIDTRTMGLFREADCSTWKADRVERRILGQCQSRGDARIFEGRRNIRIIWPRSSFGRKLLLT